MCASTVHETKYYEILAVSHHNCLQQRFFAKSRNKFSTGKYSLLFTLHIHVCMHVQELYYCFTDNITEQNEINDQLDSDTDSEDPDGKFPV